MPPRARLPEGMPLDPKRLAAAEVEIAQLRDLDLTAPKHLPKHLLLRLLAYQLQVATQGDLDPATRRHLGQVAEVAVEGTGDPESLPVQAPPVVRPGTALVREWAGVVCRVTALENGFAWNGSIYRSLSQVARAITGTRWNGRRFFGLAANGAGAKDREVRP